MLGNILLKKKQVEQSEASETNSDDDEDPASQLNVQPAQSKF